MKIVEVILMHCKVVNNSYLQNSRVLYTFVLNKSFGQLLDISPENFIFLESSEKLRIFINQSVIYKSKF